MDNNDRINRYYNDYKADLEAAKIAGLSYPELCEQIVLRSLEIKR